MPYSRFCTFSALLGAVLLPRRSGRGPSRTLLSSWSSRSRHLWGLGREFVERTSQHNTIIGAPFNALKYIPDMAPFP
jgi:hypothetical protein